MSISHYVCNINTDCKNKAKIKEMRKKRKQKNSLTQLQSNPYRRTGTVPGVLLDTQKANLSPHSELFVTHIFANN